MLTNCRRRFGSEWGRRALAVRTWCSRPPGRTVVAVDDQGAVVGIATVRPNHGGPAAHIANASFLVNPEHSGRGIGRALGTHILDRARADGYRAMQFNAVVDTNTRAVACGARSALKC